MFHPPANIDRRPAWNTAAWYAVAVLLTLLAIGPAVWLIVIAFQPPGGELYSLGGGLTLDNFRVAWNDGHLGVPLVNSVLVTLARAALNVFVAALAAYPLARMSFRGRDVIFVLLLATMMIPEQVIVVPMFRMIVGMGLYDTLAAVVLPFSVTAFGIYLCRQAFMAIPGELEEAARMDGASSLRIWWSVILPLSAPTLATLALFSVIGAWSELLWPLIVLQDQDRFTLPVALNNMMSQFEANTRAAYAAAVLSLTPILILFAVAQRFLKAELFGGAVKG
ncbi:MAG TPA: carbohydrate ABC transporter permease [Phycisphaerales bacterium]